MAIVPAEDERVLSVLQLTLMIKETLAETFPAVWVKGEISGLKRPESGHLYFNLKDGKDAVLSCTMWRTPAARLGFQPADGTEVEAFGEIDVYPPRGNYQLIVKQLRPAGLGALLLALEELKKKLGAEGLFDAARKRPLPRFPRRIGVVTSPIGAAVRDVVKVLRGRWPSIGIVLAPVRVQGEGAAAEIVAAIERFNRYGGVDVLIVGRGGGSLEDLWAFNEEPVVRAVAGSRIPIIAAVGHEVDWTLTDLAADVRAATPSNAAELAVRDAADVLHRIENFTRRLARAMRQGLLDRRLQLRALTEKYGFRRQRDVFATWAQRIDDLREQLDDAIAARVRGLRERLAYATRSYGLREWPRVLRAHREQVAVLDLRLLDAATTHVLAKRRQAIAIEDRLRALSPRLVLERGYSLVRGDGGRLLRGPESLKPGDRVTLEFARGEADARIEAVRKGGTHGPEEERDG